MREEFEAGLLEAGLQIERDKEVCICFCGTLNIIFVLPAAVEIYGSEQPLSDHKSCDWTATRQVDQKIKTVSGSSQTCLHSN